MYSQEINFGSSRTPLGNGRAVNLGTNKLQETAERVQQKCGNSMASHPIATVAAAIAIGVTLGWLVKRR